MSKVELYQSSENQFYPTPKPIADKMLLGIDWDYIQTVLEPSAGKGDLIEAVIKAAAYGKYRRDSGLDIDAIEIDPNLRAIIKDRFSRKPSEYADYLTRSIYENSSIQIVHDDFLTYGGFKQYGLIIMNPPFASGEQHLLKALKMQKYGGTVICLLNAETLKNPYTNSRRELKRQLEELNAQIEYIENGFTNAERKTDVEVAIVKVFIERNEPESDIYNHFKKSAELNDDDIADDVTDIEVTDFVKMIVSHYNVEIQSGIELIRQYRAMVPHMQRAFGTDSFDKEPILRLTDNRNRGYESISINKFVCLVRKKYWEMLLANPKFMGKLTSNLQEQYRSKINELIKYDFSEFNIGILSAEMNCHIIKGIEDAIIELFDRMTQEHSWYPECSNNTHYYNGWAHNKAHKINKKIIMPCYGVFDTYWHREFRSYEATNFLQDIEKVLNYLDGNRTKEVDLRNVIECAAKGNITKNIECKYFKVTFYKKGTCHITFTNLDLLDKFNIYASRHKGWLPPNYGKKAYSDMTAEEKTVVDEFQGESEYNKILADNAYYLQKAENMVPMLGE